MTDNCKRYLTISKPPQMNNPRQNLLHDVVGAAKRMRTGEVALSPLDQQMVTLVSEFTKDPSQEPSATIKRLMQSQL